MAKKSRRKGRPPPRRARAQRPERLSRPRPRTLQVALALAAVHALWALFQWNQLLTARSGGEVFCALGSGEACAAVWDSPFASAVQRWTLLPVAGWGVAWSLVAIALPLWTRRRLRRGRPPGAWWPATVITAFAGALAVIVLAAASVALGALCTNCVATYVLVLAYAATCARDLEPLSRPQLARGLGVASAATMAAFVLLLYPGIQTPPAGSRPDLVAIDRLAGAPAGTERDRLLERYLQSLPEDDLRSVSDLLAAYARGAAEPLRPPRSLLGQADAPVRITEFGDILCSHCADFHETLAHLRSALPPDSFSIEVRHFPLDGTCNPFVERRAAHPVRCTAAKAIICAEGQPYAFELAGALFENQGTLTEEAVYSLAEPHVAREELAACVGSPATEAKLRDDVGWAMERGIQGTPLVLLNGRTASAFPPFLTALLLAEGDAEHPLFARLPEPRRRSSSAR